VATTDTHPLADLEPGTVIGGCRLERVAGRGGMGVVYQATQLDLGRPVAVKVLTARDRDLRERFAQEARLAAAIDHPNVLPVYAAGEADGRPYIVMRWVAGTDLHRLLAREGRLDPLRAATVVAQVAAGLDAAHAAGLVHRDVKPANVLLAGEHAYLGDFGLTRLQGSDTRITERGAWVGTVDYMSPEHLRGEHCDARSDVYSLGCLLFAALTGAPPFRRETVPATMHAHLHDPLPRASLVAAAPAAFDRVLARALAKRPEERYPSAGDLGRAALAAASGESVTEAERTVARGAAAPATAPTAHVAPSTVWRAPSTGGAYRAPAAPIRRHRSLGLRVRGAIAAVGIVAVVAVWLLVRAAPQLTAGAGTGPLTEGDVRAAVGDFAAAVGDEDRDALADVLAARAQRVFPTDSQRGRRAVLATYARQFRTSEITGYALEDLAVQGGRVGRASGRYTLERADRAPAGGRIVFGVVRERGRPRVALIAATPGT
jgi:Protein kinase domain